MAEVLILSDRTVSETMPDYPVAVRYLQPVDIHVFLSDRMSSDPPQLLYHVAYKTGQ